MKNFKKIILILLVCALSLQVLTACGDKNNSGNEGGGSQSTVSGTFDYEKEFLSEAGNVSKGYNSNLFYVNTLEFQIADPTVIQVTEGPEKGYFYAYGTSDEIGCHGFQAWRSKDLSHWECTGVAYQPDYRVTWAVNNYWAPEIIYDANDKLYYLFYNAQNQFKNNRLYLSVAYSDSPAGPFVAPDGRMDANGNMLSASKPVFDFTIANPELANSDLEVMEQALDASPFIDPVTGDKYMYFSYYDSYSIGSHIFGVKMKDWFTPDYSTLTKLTVPGYRTIKAAEELDDSQKVREGGVNEGPFMVYNNGTYYLTLSIFGYTDSNYRVIQATSDSPLGTFTKIEESKGGKVISTDVANWSHLVSAGHHCFIRCGEELFIAYHTFKNRQDISGGRALGVDKVVWLKNSDGVDLMHTNGPTYSVQALPESLSGYKNIATSAKITANNTASDSDVKLLNDSLIKYQEFDLVEEYEANQGKTEINISWDTFKTVRALMVFNSYNYDKTFVQIDKAEITYKTASGKTEVLTVKNIGFDWKWHFESDWLFMRPGGSAIAEFAEMPVKNIKLTISTPQGAERLAIGEIIVLGKDSECAGVSKFEDYSYTINSFASSHIEKDSANFGTIPETDLDTFWGYDLSHDNGSADAYITNEGVSDQYCYFKGVYDTSFYVEASFTVTTNKAFSGDPYPKFGIVVSCDDIYSNTIFYYVDAVNYVKSEVGCAQRRLDNSDWDWTATERLVPVSGLNYTNGNYVKLAILRQNEKFYFICNGMVVISHDAFSIFVSDQKAGVGFLSFNTPTKIKDYYATSDSAVIAQKASELGI